MNWSLADQVVVSGGNLLTGVLIARFLGIEQFGVFSLIWLVVLLFQGIQSAAILAPLATIGPKEQQSDARQSYYGIMLLQQLLYAVGSMALAAILLVSGPSDWFGGVGADVTASLLAVIVATQIQEFLRRYNYADGRAARVFLSDLVRYCCQLGLLLGFFLLAPSTPRVGEAIWLIAVGAIAGALAMTGAWPALPRSLADVRPLVSRQLSFSRWLLGSAIMQWISGNMVIVVTGALLGPAAVGALKAAQNLLGVTHIYFLAAENVGPPRASRLLATKGRAALNNFAIRLGIAVVASTAIIGIVFSLNAELLLVAIFGESYAGNGLLVLGMAGVYLLYSMAIPIRFVFLALEATRPIFQSHLLAAVVTLFACYPLAHLMGPLGAVLCLAASAITPLVVLGYAAHRIREKPNAFRH